MDASQLWRPTKHNLRRRRWSATTVRELWIPSKSTLLVLLKSQLNHVTVLEELVATLVVPVATSLVATLVVPEATSLVATVEHTAMMTATPRAEEAAKAADLAEEAEIENQEEAETNLVLIACASAKNENSN